MSDKKYRNISLIEEIAVMETGVVYLIPAPFCSISKVVLEDVESILYSAGESYDYSVQELSRKEVPSQLLSWESLLKTTVVLPIFMPDQVDFHYLIAFCKKDSLKVVIKEMITTAEIMSKESAKNALINLAYNDPDLFEDMLYEEDLLFDDEEKEDNEKVSFFGKAKNIGKRIGNILTRCIRRAIEPGPMMMDMPDMSMTDLTFDPCTGEFEVRSGEDDLHEQIASLKETNELIKRFIHNVKKLKETDDPVARKEVNWVIDNSVGFSDKLWKKIFKDCDLATQKDIFKKFIDRNTLGKKSKVIVEIEKTPNEIVEGNIGYYRISLLPEGWEENRKIYVEFTHQATSVVYMMYLIDRHDRKKKVDCLGLTPNKTNFKSLYQKVYELSPCDIDNEYDKLLYEKQKNGEKKYRSGKLRHCYLDISTTMSRLLEDIENPVPFQVNRSSHLTIDPEHIKIPKELKKFHFS